MSRKWGLNSLCGGLAVHVLTAPPYTPLCPP